MQERFFREIPLWGRLSLLLAVLVHLLIGLVYSAQHFFIPDEIVYFMMTKALAAGQLAIDTGYESFPSPMFIFGLSVEHGGKVYPQYPVIYSALGLPFFLLGGKAGLFFINQLAFIGVLWLVYSLHKLLFSSNYSAVAAVLLTAFGSYFWNYSQVLAPHMLQVFLLLLALWFVARVRLDMTQRPELLCLLAGLVFGVALGVRYDTLFALPALILPFLFVRPVRWRLLLCLLPGIFLSLALLSGLNAIKFGQAVPISYATNSEGGNSQFQLEYLAYAGVALVTFIAVWLTLRRAEMGRPVSWQWLALAAVVGIATASIAAPMHVLNLLRGFNFTVVDYSSLSLDAPLSASAARTEDGGVLFLGEYKRSLLQSASFICLISVLAFQSKLRLSRREWGWICWLALVPGAFIFFFSMRNWEGGFAYHMRYYVPVLPFLAMMAAHALWRLCAALRLSSPKDWRAPLLLGGVLSVLLVLYADAAPPALRELLFLKWPLWLWPLLLFLTALAFYDKAPRFLRQLVLMVAGIACIWGGASSMLIVFPHFNLYRESLYTMSASYMPYLEKKSVVVSVPRYFTGFFEAPEWKLYVATIFEDGEVVTKEDMRKLVEHFTAQNTAVYMTHDMASMPIIRRELPKWNYRFELVRGADQATQTPAISRFVPVKRAAP